MHTSRKLGTVSNLKLQNYQLFHLPATGVTKKSFVCIQTKVYNSKPLTKQAFQHLPSQLRSIRKIKLHSAYSALNSSTKQPSARTNAQNVVVTREGFHLLSNACRNSSWSAWIWSILVFFDVSGSFSRFFGGIFLSKISLSPKKNTQTREPH